MMTNLSLRNDLSGLVQKLRWTVKENCMPTNKTIPGMGGGRF